MNIQMTKLKLPSEFHENMRRLDKAFFDALIKAQRARCQILEKVVKQWTRGDPGLCVGLVLENHADGRDILRVRAGPHWAEGQAGAGPALIELPPLKVKVVD